MIGTKIKFDDISNNYYFYHGHMFLFNSTKNCNNVRSTEAHYKKTSRCSYWELKIFMAEPRLKF